MVVLYILVGLLGGLMGGMGMGGGTLLIPLAVYLLKTEQRAAQLINLVSFVPMSGAALAVHAAGGLVKMKGAWLLLVGGVAAAIAGSVLAKNVSAENLGRYFGLFLAFLGVAGFFTAK